jgi:putative transcriptional regulator
MNTYHATANHDSGSKVPTEVLLDYASGAAPEPVALAVATMLAMNPQQAAAYNELNALGGAMLEALPSNSRRTADDGLAAMMALLDTTPEQKHISRAQAPLSILPEPLHAYVGADVEALEWTALTAGVEEYVFNTSTLGYRTSLLRIAPGKAMPTHSHHGLELTVVLDGAYQAGGRDYARGDMEIAGVNDEHKPVADGAQGCLCLAVLSAPLRLSGIMGWFINPFLKI